MLIVFGGVDVSQYTGVGGGQFGDPVSRYAKKLVQAAADGERADPVEQRDG